MKTALLFVLAVCVVCVSCKDVGAGEKYVVSSFYDNQSCSGSESAAAENIITTGCIDFDGKGSAYHNCTDAGVVVKFGCNNDCSKCESNTTTLPVNKCTNGRIARCSNTMPVISTDRVVEVHYASESCNGTVVQWTSMPSECMKMHEGYGVLECVNGKVTAKEECKDNKCTQGCQTRTPDTTCHVGRKLQCGGTNMRF
eukprot:TRINITY_DN228_c0_g1_i4.p1 TRINITY_DN228_c0_g1~~TRINITY_DN228_c0_g1_i4.p1  ORF type:complete len:215 (-),score=51.59 TRINITY_DN228_c0_g1_i4:166-759(-)